MKPIEVQARVHGGNHHLWLVTITLPHGTPITAGEWRCHPGVGLVRILTSP